MRLHNRQVKAAFWTDTELIKLLNIPGRMFYQGLWQLADDSGCLEHDMLAFKIHLFPADSEITTDIIEEWVDKLIGSKKLIPYEAGDKKCLFLKNFHKHQTLKNCPPPDVPLPFWITFEAYASNEKQGKYVFDEDKLNSFLEPSYNKKKVKMVRLRSSYNKKKVSDDSLQSSSNQNQNQNQNLEPNRNLEYKSDSGNPTKHGEPKEIIFKHWNSKDIIRHRRLTDKIERAINGALRDYGEDEICRAIDTYALILKDDKYYWSYKWGLREFLQRGIDKFLDFDIASQNYLSSNKARGDPKKHVPRAFESLMEWAEGGDEG